MGEMIQLDIRMFEDQLKRAINIKKDSIKQLSQNMYRVQSETESVFYDIDVTNGFALVLKEN